MTLFVHGPASWNRIVLLDRLPDPVPHMVFANRWWDTVGGTSAGKAIGLAGLGHDTVLATALAGDAEGELVRSLLERVGVRMLVSRSGVTERHLNLMTPQGERLSIYLAQPPGAPPEHAHHEALREAMTAAAALVLDLSPASRDLLPLARATGRPLWVDLHDYDGHAEFHQPFLEAADVVFLNGDRTGDPRALLERCLRFGAAFAVCTLGADGALALASSGRSHATAAVPTRVVDTNGAGDAFFAGALDAHLAGADLPELLAAGAAHAAGVLQSRHLHPALDALLGTP